MSDDLRAKCSCSACGNHLDFPVEAAGQVINCPHCGDPTELSLIAPSPASDRPSAAELVAAFEGTIPRTRVSVLYQLGLVLVSLVMVLLPLIYVMMIGAAAWGVYEYATHFLFLVQGMRGGPYFYLIKLVLYIAPLFAGVVLVFFMIKPLFARRPPQVQPLAMNPALQPALYAVIARISDLVGAPMPVRISLDCNLNASAGFRKGASSLLSNDLVLTIGLPLVAGLNLQQFVGVVAHEFGHFSQGFGLRLSYLIRSINLWFARVVYERDAWDVSLEQWSMEVEDWRAMLVATCARMVVGLSRLFLKLLMFLGHGVSCFLLRQMEYDADSYQIKIAGSTALESTMRRLAVLGVALGKAYKEMRTAWNLNRKLPDNLPSYLAFHESKLPPALKQKVQDTLGLSRTGVFDAHPSDGDRIRRARQAGDPGVFHLELPASVLFSHFDIVARQVTHLHYSDDLGLSIDNSNLRAVLK
jgi:Zn-dependent protease with chaperone function